MEFGIEFGSVRSFFPLYIIIVLLREREREKHLLHFRGDEHEIHFIIIFLLDVKKAIAHHSQRIIAMLSWMRTHNIRNQMLCNVSV